MKYKVGDKVLIYDNRLLYHLQIGEIVEIRDSDIYPCIIRLKEDYITHCYKFEELIRLNELTEVLYKV